MKVCSKCRQVVQNTEQFCPKCGNVRFMRVNNNPNEQRPPMQRTNPNEQRPPMQRTNPNEQRPPMQRTNPQEPETNNVSTSYNTEQQYDNNNKSGLNEGSVKDWLLTLLFLIIPVYNIIFIIKSLRSKEIPEYKRNYFKAFIIYFGVAFTVSMIISIIFTSVIVLIIN